jgi:Sugar kinases, ribokinase family
MKKILILGSSNTDMTVKTPAMPVPGETVLGGEFTMSAGGKGANQAVAAKRVGGNVSFICKVGPYTAIVLFSLAVPASHFVFGTLVMKKPFVGEPVKMGDYFKGDGKTHMVGMCGGAIWCLGTALSCIAAGKAGV